MKKKLFIAATRQNDGKTTIALGLILNLREHFQRIGFIKPIGQRYLLEEGFKVDEDSILIEKVCNFPIPLKDLNPIAVEKGFTERYIRNPDPQSITSQILDSFEKVGRDTDLIIIEGTGHAGVGSVFDHSNARVAKLLGAKVLLISSGGIGRPIDEIVLNKALFDKEGAEFLGVIVNKVLQAKYDKISNLVREGLKRLGIQELGIIPYHPILSAPTVEQIAEEMKLPFLAGEERKDNLVEKIIIGAMEPHEALKYIEKNTLVITPGDREDLILAAIGSHLLPESGEHSIAGILLTGGIVPDKRILEMVRKVKIPLLIAQEDTYTVAAKIHDLTVKIRPNDKEKIELVKDIVRRYVCIDKILENV
jgi:hypothetical protein